MLRVFLSVGLGPFGFHRYFLFLHPEVGICFDGVHRGSNFYYKTCIKPVGQSLLSLSSAIECCVDVGWQGANCFDLELRTSEESGRMIRYGCVGSHFDTEVHRKVAKVIVASY